MIDELRAMHERLLAMTAEVAALKPTADKGSNDYYWQYYDLRDAEAALRRASVYVNLEARDVLKIESLLQQNRASATETGANPFGGPEVPLKGENAATGAL